MEQPLNDAKTAGAASALTEVLCEDECKYCDGEGRIEMDNNGPIVDCPICNGTGLAAHNV